MCRSVGVSKPGCMRASVGGCCVGWSNDCSIALSFRRLVSPLYPLGLSLQSSTTPGVSAINIFHQRRSKVKGDKRGKYGVVELVMFCFVFLSLFVTAPTVRFIQAIFCRKPPAVSWAEVNGRRAEVNGDNLGTYAVARHEPF